MTIKISDKDILKKYIFDLSDELFDESEIHEIALNLEELYQNGFRHNYSDFFPYILEIAQEDNKHNLDYLSNNLEELLTHVENGQKSDSTLFINLYPHLVKLCDHLNLEIGRYNYYSVNDKRIYDIEAKLPELRSQLTESAQELQRASKKASTMQTELISVLSIFSAIVISFFGGISFIGNALAGMQHTQIYKTIIIVLICGVVLVNTIFLLIYLVGKITERNIYARCKSDFCTCGLDGAPKCNPLRRIRKRLPYIFYLNLFLVALMILDVVFWTLDIKGIIVHFF